MKGNKMNRRDFIKILGAGAGATGISAVAGALVPTQPQLVPVAYDQYYVGCPLRDRGMAPASLGEIDLNNPLEGIAKLVAQKNYHGPGADQTVEIKPGATNKFTLITPGDPQDIDLEYWPETGGKDPGWSEELVIKHEFHSAYAHDPHAQHDHGVITVFCDWGQAYFLFTFKPEHKAIIVAKLGLE